MNSRLSTSNSKKAPVAFIATIIVLMAVELILPHWTPYWKTLQNYVKNKRETWVMFESQLHQMADRNDEKTDMKNVVIVGGSGAREAIDCSMLESIYTKHKIKCHNLGTTSMGPHIMYFNRNLILSKKIDLLIWIGPHKHLSTLFAFGSLKRHKNIKTAFFLLQYGGWIEFNRYLDVLFQGIPNSLFSFFKYRSAIKSIYADVLKDLFLQKEFRSTPHLAHRHTGDMRKPERYFKYLREEIDEIPKRKRKKRFINLSRSPGMNYMPKLIDAIQEKNIPLLFIECPDYTLMAKVRPEIALYETRPKLLELLDRKKVTYKQKTVFDFLKDEDFFDYSHLNGLGRAKATRYLADLLENSDYLQ